jgi:arginine-tRNA-protein transferase
MDESPAIMEFFTATAVPAGVMDLLWADGWRHFGANFFRYDRAVHAERECRVVPLRIDLREFAPSPSQRRILRRAQKALRVRIGPARITPEHMVLFEIHKQRFAEAPPGALTDVISPEPAHIPCRCLGIDLFAGEQLAAASYLDVGETAASSVYGIFHPSAAKLSPGILTMLIEIAEARRLGLRHYYHGYRYNIPSPYDYKRRFSAIEEYNWRGAWTPAGPWG